MAWKPRLPPVSTEAVPVARRPWIAVAESHAEEAVNLFVNIMKNQRHPIKVRMDAATRICQIAGATFRGERQDGHGRPAANLPVGHGFTKNKLSTADLRAALRILPEGTVLESPEELADGEVAMVLHDGEHTRKETGHIVHAVAGSMVIGKTPPGEAEVLIRERLARQAEADAIREAKLAEEAEQLAKKRAEMMSSPSALLDGLFKQGGNVRATTLGENK